MSIASKVYTIDGDRLVVEVMTDHLGQKYQTQYFAPAAWGATELQARLDADAVELAARLADDEAERVIS